MRILNAEPYRYNPEAKAILEKLGDLDEISLTPAGLLQAVIDYDVTALDDDSDIRQIR